MHNACHRLPGFDKEHPEMFCRMQRTQNAGPNFVMLVFDRQGDHARTLVVYKLTCLSAHDSNDIVMHALAFTT